MGLGQAKIAVLLVGGHSRRMGMDKCNLEINGQVQWQFMKQELESYFDQVYLSCRADQQGFFQNQELILDVTADIGPMGALYSSFSHLPDATYIFFVACDLPNFSISVAQQLYQEFDGASHVCAAQSKSKSFAEPLVAIWNRTALPFLKHAIGGEHYALFQCMKRLEVQTVNLSDDTTLHNVNRPEDL